MTRIEWGKWSAIAEVIGAAAIVITLAYLVVQTQQNTDALIASTRQSAVDAEVAWLYRLMDTPEAAIGLYSESNDDEQVLRSTRLLASALFRNREAFFLLYRDGALDAATWEPYRDTLVNMLRENPLVMQVWRENGATMVEEFLNDVNVRLTELSGEELGQ